MTQTQTQAQQFMRWIAKVHGPDVVRDVRKHADEGSLESLSASLDLVLSRRQATQKEGADPSADSDDLAFDNDFLIL